MTIPELHTGAHRLRKAWKVWLGGGVLLLLIAIFVVGLTLQSQHDSQVPLDSTSTGSTGARAVAEVLRDHGVSVTPYDHMPPNQSDAVTVVVGDEFLGYEQTDALRESRGDVVLITPTDQTLTRLELGVEDAYMTAPGFPVTDAGCDADAVAYAPTLRGDWQPVAVDPESAERADIPVQVEHRCYYRGTSRDLVSEEDRDGYGYVEVRQGDRTVHVVAADMLFTNRGVTEADNAAFALNLLGQYETVNWWLVEPAPLENTEQAMTSLEKAFGAWLWWVVVMAVTLWLWGGRRFGKVVREKLPVHVESVEATHGLATLYRRFGATARAAELLRAGALRALAETLGVPRRSSREEVLEATAERLQQPVAEVAGIFGRRVTDPASLAALDRDLRDVVRRTRTTRQAPAVAVELPSLAAVSDGSSVSASESDHNISGER